MMNVYCIYDKVAETIASQLMCAETDELMIRSIKTATLNEIIEHNVEDFDLYCLGEIDDKKPVIVGLANARFVAHLEAFKNVKQN